MTLLDFLHTTNLDHSLLIGYYGGGNYGDELLLEVLGNLLRRQGANGVAITYQRPETYPTMHHDFGFKLVNIHDRKAVFRAALGSQNILIGGGGLWGVDMNLNTLLLSLFLFVSRWALRKRIYLLGVGYYKSTNWMGRIGGWLAGKAANHIIARDAESLKQFKKLSKHVSLDRDMAWYTDDLRLASYTVEAKTLQEQTPIGGKTLLVALRRPQASRQQQDFVRYNQLITRLIKNNPNRPIVMVMMESETKDTELYDEARRLRRRHKHLRIIEAPYNPLTLFAYIRQSRERLAVIAPQLHLLMSAHLSRVPFFPLTYDNKVSMLFDQIEIPDKRRVALHDVTIDGLQSFTDDFFGRNRA